MTPVRSVRGRGMNSGITDADRAASTISVALQAVVDETVRTEIETYAARREQAAEWNKKRRWAGPQIPARGQPGNEDEKAGCSGASGLLGTRW
jgi:2-polyprenyl-6-methoxyphenol hydroxylase-like FAD-dependent oxidoreductase